MPSDRSKDLKKSIRKLTKRIGQALQSNDHAEATNLRKQRSGFIKQLAEECEEYFFVDENGRSQFSDLETAKEHYSDPDVRKKVAISEALSEMFQGRESLRKRTKDFDGKSSDEVKEQVMKELADQMTRIEKGMQELAKETGKDPYDFDKIDKDRDSDGLDGIDMSSLL